MGDGGMMRIRGTDLLARGIGRAVLLTLVVMGIQGTGVAAMPRTILPGALENLKQNCERFPEAAKLREKLIAAPDTRLMEATDDWLIDFIPNPRVKRSLHIHEGDISYGCPVHRGGRYVFTGGGDPFVPYQLTCSIGGEVYPNEDFPESGSPESPWDEQGWLDTRKSVDGESNPTYGLRYHFNAHYAYWTRWMKVGPFLRQLATAHFLAEEDDPRKDQTAHAAAVLLLRLTAVFPQLERDDFRSTEWVHGFPFVVGIMDYVWEPSHTDQYALAFDYVKDAILADESLLRLDYGRTGRAWGDDPENDQDGDGAVTTADLVAWVETALLREYGERYAAIPPTYANATLVHQKTLSLLATVLDEPKYYEHARSVLLDHLATNWFTNDGAYYEGSIPGYGKFGLKSLRDAAVWLRRFDPDLVSPRIVKGYLFTPSMVCVDATLPNSDDSGGVQLGKLRGSPGFDTDEYQAAYLDYRDPRLLRVLSNGKDYQPTFRDLDGLLADCSEERADVIRRAIGKAGSGRLPSTVTRSGYAVLRGGGETMPFDMFVTFDSQGGSHTHYDTFNPILYGYDYILVPELGYPPRLQGPSRGDWISHPLSHWTVTVDRKSIDRDFERGHVTLLVDRPGFRAISLRSPSSYKGITSTYERVLCLIDTPEGKSIVVDFFCVRGGTEHLYSFHGAAPDGTEKVSVAGGALEDASEMGTLQGLWHGMPTAYAEPIEGSEDRCLAYLAGPRVVTPDDEAKVLRFTFPRGDDEGTALDFWMPTACADGFVIAEGRREPVAGRGSARLPYLVARSGDVDAGEEIESLFCGVVEAHQGGGAIADVQLDPESGEVRIAFGDGSAWALRAKAEEIEFVSEDAGGAGARRILAALADIGGVASVDYESRVVGLDGPGPLSDGELLIFGNELGRNTYYEVEATPSAGKVAIGDRWTDLRVARGYLTGRSEGTKVLTDQDYVIQHPIRAQCRGARVFNETGTSHRVVAVEGDGIVLDASPEACAAFAVDSDGDGRMAFDIYDFGVGDAVMRIQVDDSLDGGEGTDE